MIKKIFLVISSILVLVAAGIIALHWLAAGREPDIRPQSMPLYIGATFGGRVRMDITEKDNDRIAVTVTNDTIYTLETGEAVIIERYNDGNWWIIPRDYPIALSLTIRPAETMDFSAFIGDLLSGRYRIRQRVIGENYTHDLVAKFYVD